MDYLVFVALKNDKWTALQYQSDLVMSNWLTKPYWVEQLLAQFHMVCVLFSNICTLLHSKIHTATAWVTTLSFRWIKLFFLPFLSFFFHTSLRNDLVLAQISATNWKLYKLRRQRKEEKKSFRTLSLLLRRHGAQLAGGGCNRPILASVSIKIWIRLDQICPKWIKLD